MTTVFGAGLGSRSLAWQTAVGLAGIAMALLVSGPASAAESCWPTARRAAPPACSGGSIRNRERRAVIALPSGADPPRMDTIESLTRPRTLPSSELAPARARARKLDPQVMALLQREIAELQTLLRLTPTGARDRPELLRRLGDRYAELERASRRDRGDYLRRAALFADNGQVGRAQQLRALAVQAGVREALARQGAIDAYAALDAQFPTWCQYPQRARSEQRCADDVLFRLAQAHEHADEPARAEQTYRRLLSRFPTSPRAMAAELARAELLFSEAAKTPALWPNVARALERIRARLSRNARLRGPVTYRLAHAYWHQGQFERALARMVGVLEQTAGQPSRASVELHQAARRDAVLLYALAGEPTRAFSFFQQALSGRASVIATLESLGRTYLDVGLYANAKLLYAELLRQNGGPASCSYRAQLVRAILATTPDHHSAIVDALRQLLRTQRTFRALGVDSAVEQHCTHPTIRLLASTASHWHHEATAAEGASSPAAERQLAAAATLYRALLDNFTQAELDRVSWPGVAADRRPTRQAIGYALADLLWAQGKWLACGRAFDELARSAPGHGLADDAVLGAAACYLRGYRERDSSQARVWPASESEPTAADDADAASEPALEAMQASFDRYLCRVQAPREPGSVRERHVQIQVASARLAADAGRHAQAAKRFRRVALNHPDSPWGPVAGQRYLDAMIRAGSAQSAPRPGCFDEAARVIPQLEKLYCGGTGLVRNADHCASYGRRHHQLGRQKAAALLAQCELGGPAARARCAAAGAQHERMWERHGRAACRLDGPECLGSGRFLYHGARAYEAAGHLTKAVALRETLLEPRYHLADTPLAQRAWFELAGNYRAMGQRATAARHYEAFVRRNPDLDEAPRALYEAVRLRLELGAVDEASGHASQLLARYGRSSPRLAGDAALAVAERFAAQQDWIAVRGQLMAAQRPLAASVLDVRVGAFALLGRANVVLKRSRAATRAYRIVRDTWSDEPARLRELAALGGSESEQRARKTRVLAAVAESLFFLGEQRRRQAEAIPLPTYRGLTSRRGVERHASGAVADWIRARGQAIDAAAELYERILQLNDGHPPLEYAAKSRVALGRMWADAVMALRTARHPRRWNRPGYIPGSHPPLLWAELRAAYREMLWARSLPLEPRAVLANSDCVALGIRLGQPKRTKVCEHRLSQLQPESPSAAERMAAAPSLLGAKHEPRAQPLDMDGTPIRDEAGD